MIRRLAVSLWMLIAVTDVVSEGAGQTPPAMPTHVQRPPAQAKEWVPPRTRDGQPDVQGFWTQVAWPMYLEVGRPADTSPRGLSSFYEVPFQEDSSIVDPPDRKIPYQPWARERQEAIDANRRDPTGKPFVSLDYMDRQTICWPAGVPRSNYATPYNGYQILQTPGYVTILSEWNHTYRIIPLDGRPHIGPNIRLFMGDSRGRWEGNTLVVTTTNLNGKAWLDMRGSIHSDAMRVVERYTFADANTINYEATIEDPKAFTRPFTLALSWKRAEPNYELFEYACHEGNDWFREFLPK